MKVNTKSSNKKVAVVMAALSATLAFGGALAYLTDHDTRVNDVAFQQMGGDQQGDEEGLISLVEAKWDADKDGTGNTKGAGYAARGILPGETLTKDPTIKINDWLTRAAGKGKNTPNLNLFMRVLVPVEEVTGDATADELFLHEANAPSQENGAGWALLPGGVTDMTVNDEDATAELPAGTYKVYRYFYSDSVDGESLATAGAGSTVRSLFDTVTYISTATKAPSANRHIVVDAYAIQADNLSASAPADVYKLASGETVTNA